MADPLAIAGAAASVPDIVKLLDKTVSTLHELHNRWKKLNEADFISINFIAPTQFIALESALGRLQEWMKTDMDEPHQQLVMDLQASMPSLRAKWINQFEHTTSIAFFVDLRKYDHDPEAPLGESNQTRMVEPLCLFDVMVNSRWFAHTSIILLLCNVGRFREMLNTRHLSNYFPVYTGGNNVIEASEYLLTWFIDTTEHI